MKPTMSGRLDLICALAQDDPLLRTWVSELLGFHEVSVAPIVQTAPAIPSQRTEPESSNTPYEPVDTPLWPSGVSEALAIAKGKIEPISDTSTRPLWRLEAYEALAIDEVDVEPVSDSPSEPIWRLRPMAAPDVIPLTTKQILMKKL